MTEVVGLNVAGVDGDLFSQVRPAAKSSGDIPFLPNVIFGFQRQKDGYTHICPITGLKHFVRTFPPVEVLGVVAGAAFGRLPPTVLIIGK